ncbi:MAG: SulP family inorganic anion transporter [Bacteroidia bacterium]
MNHHSSYKNPFTLLGASDLQDLQKNWKTDMLSGFLVFLLALPLSLGIAKASGFPASMGVLTAMVGGLITPLFRVSPLTIKGPAAGLITVCSGAFLEFGGESYWPMVTAAVMVASLLQLLLALGRLGSLSDLFPHSAVHGMLAAIGIIIISKQFPVLMGVAPDMYAGKPPLELLAEIPNFIRHAQLEPAILGVVSLIIMFLYPSIQRGWLKKVPAPMWVLLIAIPTSLARQFSETLPAYTLVHIGDFWGDFGFHFNFSLIGTWVFWKYVLMFLFINSLESLLTVKAIDSMDPQKRTSDYNGDLFGLGVGNFVSSILGGLPMISEVVRSSANVGFGAQTKWSNFFHGAFLLLSMLLLIPIIELIPNAALAAMLLFAGYRLASPRQFRQTLQIGWEQLAIFLVTIGITLAEDLLLGVASGITLKLLIHITRWLFLGSFFKPNFVLRPDLVPQTLEIQGAALFTHLIGYKKVLERLSNESLVRIDFSHCEFVDHSFLEFIEEQRNHALNEKREILVTGLEGMKPISRHPLASRVRVNR